MEKNSEYLIRRSVLDMTGEEWRKLKEIYPSKEFKTTAENFLDKIGLPGGMTAYYNLSERAFFDEIYDLYRRRLKKCEQKEEKR